jgi:molybdopterin-synthase adenylyltransferase
MTRDLSRQSFLGDDSAIILASVKVGVIGLCGGGSHVVQQLAHMGVLNFVIADPQTIDDSNLNRCVGATAQDVKDCAFKTDIAGRTIKNINPDAEIVRVRDNWQSHQISLRDCAVIFGCVDSIIEREQIDRFCRRFLIHYIDIGMDVVRLGNSHRIVGQVAVSSPGCPCLRCMAIISEDHLRDEANHYGDAGPRHGLLASTAISLFVQLVTPWHPNSTETAYCEYNGNDNILSPSPRTEYVRASPCMHFRNQDLGDPFFRLDSITQLD